MTTTEEPHDLNRLAALVEDRLGTDDREQLIAHLADCTMCRDVLATLTREHLQTQPVRRVPFAWMSVAAVLVLASAVVLLRPRFYPPPEATVPQAAPEPQAPAAQPPVAAPTVPTQPRRTTEPFDTRRGSERTVDGKTFRLVAGEWVDSSYREIDGLPVVDVRSAAERADLIARTPALAPFTGLGNRVTVVWDKIVYRFDLPAR